MKSKSNIQKLLVSILVLLVVLVVAACDSFEQGAQFALSEDKNTDVFSENSRVHTEETIEEATYTVVYYRYNDGANGGVRYEDIVTQNELENGYHLLDFVTLNTADEQYFWVNNSGEKFDSLAVGENYGFAGWDDAPTVLNVSIPTEQFVAGAQITASDFNSEGVLKLYPVWATAIPMDSAGFIQASIHLLVPTEAWEMSEIIPHSAIESQTYYNKVGYVTFSTEAFLDPFNALYPGFGYHEATDSWITRFNDKVGRGVAQYDGKDDSTPDKSVEDYLVKGTVDYSPGGEALKQLLLKMESDGFLQDYVYYDEVLEDLADNGSVDWFFLDFYKIIAAQTTPSTNASTGIISEQFHVDAMLGFDPPMYDVTFVEADIEGTSMTGADVLRKSVAHGQSLPNPPENWYASEEFPHGYELLDWSVLNEDGSAGMTYEEYAKIYPEIKENVTFVAILDVTPAEGLSDELSKTYDGTALAYTGDHLWERVLKDKLPDISSYKEMLNEYSLRTNETRDDGAENSLTDVGEKFFTYSVVNKASNLTVYEVEIALSVQKSELTVSPRENYSKTFGEPDPNFEYRIQGLAPTDSVEQVFSSIQAVRTASGENYGEYEVEVIYTPNTSDSSKFANYDVVKNTAMLLILRSGEIGAVASPISVTYDGEGHAIDVDVMGIVEGEPAEIFYSITGGEPYNLTTSPVCTDVSDSRTVYYMVKTLNYTPYYGSARVTINPAPAGIRAHSYSKMQGEEDPEFNASVTGVVSGEKLNYRIDRKEGEVPGEYAIMPVSEDNPNYRVTVTDGVLTIESPEQTATPLPTLTVTPEKEADMKDVPDINVDEDNNISIVPGSTAPPTNVSVDGNSLNEGDYTVDDDGVIRLSGEYLKGLPDGSHVIRVEYGDDVFESGIIMENGIPLSAGSFFRVELGHWSIFNLICTLITIVFACAYFIPQSKPAQGSNSGEKSHKSLWVVTALFSLSAVSILLLFLTQNFSLPMGILDGFSIVFAILVLAQLLIRLIFGREHTGLDFGKNRDSVK